MLDITPLAAFHDNYIWLIRHAMAAGGPNDHVIVVDPGDARPVLDFLQSERLRVSAVLITHKCYDHVAGIAALVARHPAPVYGPSVDHVTDVSHPLKDNETVKIGEIVEFKTMLLPGHTLGHLAFYTPGHVFVGDVMFAAGCGRIKAGGNAKQMFCSLQKLAQLPQDTKVYCAHEYTEANLAFARTVEPGNEAITQRIETVSALRKKMLPSLPSTLAEELATNPFLRCNKAKIVQSVSTHADKYLPSELEVFTELRRWKDRF